MKMLVVVHLSSSEIISCKECGQHFDTIDALREHEKSEKEDKELQIRDFKVHMYNRNIIAATFLLLMISLYVTLSPNNNTSELTIPDPVFAQVKGGLSTSSVNPNSSQLKAN